MKEKIYTIPVNEVFNTDCECPMCALERKTEKDALEYALGPAMMEPDYRVLSNEKGYCKQHLESLLQMSEKLSLALTLDTYLAEINKKFSEFENAKDKGNGSGIFKKDKKDSCEEFLEYLHKVNSDCVICDKIEYTMQRYIDVMIYMLQKEEDFKRKFSCSKGLCLKHFEEALRYAKDNLSKKEFERIRDILTDKEKKKMSELGEDVHRFTLKFDYRNKDMDWGGAKDALKRCGENLR